MPFQPPYNNRNFPPKLNGFDPNKEISRKEFMNGNTAVDNGEGSSPIDLTQTQQLPIYYGPGQPVPIPGLNDSGTPIVPYGIPTAFPTSSQILKIPTVIRFYWEDPSINVDFDIWQGYATFYEWRSVSTSYDFDLVYTPNDSVYPSHIHTGPTPFNDGLPFYYAEFGIEFGGGTNGFVCSGQTNYFVPAIKINTNGPLSIIDYWIEGSILAAAIYDAAEIEGAVPGSPCGDVGSCAPETTGVLGITESQSGPCCVGVGPPIILGTYSIDGIPFGDSIKIPYKFSIEPGYEEPPSVNINDHASNWTFIGETLRQFYSPSQFNPTFDPVTGDQMVFWPWFDNLMIPPGTVSIWDSLIFLAPNYFGSANLHIICLSAPWPIPSVGDSVIQAIKLLYPTFSGTNYVFCIDYNYMKFNGVDLLVGGIDGIIGQPLGELCGAMSEYGWIYGGHQNFDDPQSVIDNMKEIIDLWLSTFPYYIPNYPMLEVVQDQDGNTYSTVGNSAPTDGAVIIPGSDTEQINYAGIGD